MEKSITKNLKSVISSFKTDEITKSFEDSYNEFEALVEKGIIQKRGNNAFSTPDITTEKVSFNRG